MCTPRSLDTPRHKNQLSCITLTMPTMETIVSQLRSSSTHGARNSALRGCFTVVGDYVP